MKKPGIDQMVKCPVCGAMSYPLVNKSQIDFLKEGEEILLMCGSCKRIMNPFLNLMKEYAAKFEALKKESEPVDDALIDPTKDPILEPTQEKVDE